MTISKQCYDKDRENMQHHSHLQAFEVRHLCQYVAQVCIELWSQKEARDPLPKYQEQVQPFPWFHWHKLLGSHTANNRNQMKNNLDILTCQDIDYLYNLIIFRYEQFSIISDNQFLTPVWRAFEFRRDSLLSFKV